MIRVIINADDLGKDAVVNDAIADALQKKCITSSTIMANSSTWEQVHQIVDANPQASFGVHLNLTEGKAMTDSPVLRKYGIVDNENCFTKQIQKQNSITEDLREAVFEEWCAQVEKVKKVEGIKISHVDGHHHIHTKPELINELIKLINKYEIRAFRRDYCLPMPILSLIHLMCNSIIRGKINRIKWHKRIARYAKTTDYFCSYRDLSQNDPNVLHFKSNCSIELMCHPGHPQYQFETQLINEHIINQLIDIRLISYYEI